MDLRNVFYAASFGHLAKLKKYLFGKSQSEIQTIVSAITDDTTPLIMACRNGHLDVVLYLMETCCANVMQEGSYVDYEANHTITGVTPLWCAAFAGQLDIVKALIQYKACVNVTNNQLMNLSPLCAALSAGNFQTVQFLVEQGADVNAKGKHGQTLLHLCARTNNISSSKILLEYGAEFHEDDSGLSPLLLAASEGKTKIAHFFIEKLKLPKLEIIHAMELLGASKIDYENDLITAIDYWDKATILRYQDSEHPIPKALINSTIGTEFCDRDQLYNLDVDLVTIQALLVRQRILGLCHEGTISHFLEAAKCFSDVREDYHLGNQLFLYVVDGLQSKQQPSLNDKASTVLANILGRFTALVISGFALPFQDALKAFKKSVTGIEIASKQEDFVDTNVMILPLHFIGLMYHLKKDEAEKDELMESASELLKLPTRNEHGDSFLHLACFGHNLLRDKYLAGTEFLFPSLSVLTVLLEAGEFPNARNVFGDTPLHFAAKSAPCNFKIVKLLLQHGAHLDISNFKNETPLQFLTNSSFFDLSPLKYLNLKCLCSQVINTHCIPYTGKLPKSLKTFVDMHCAKEFE